MNELRALRHDLDQHGVPPTDEEWRGVCDRAVPRQVPRRATILDSGRIGSSWIFVASGYAASYYTHGDGRLTLTRFFEPGQLAGNVTSTWSNDYGSDELTAITDVSYVEIPHDFLLVEYMQGQTFGAYIRMKVIETLRYDKDLLVCQALNDPAARYRFLEDRHPCLLELALKKDVAAFLGVTPQGYSRFLRRRKAG
ncbi:MAG: cyclic nucleotide-binding domain-containing protein [Pseudomonadota bacterium]